MLASIGLFLVLTGFGLIFITSAFVSPADAKPRLYHLWLGGRYLGFGTLLPGLIITALAKFVDRYWIDGIVLLLIGPVFLVFWTQIHKADQKRAKAKQ